MYSVAITIAIASVYALTDAFGRRVEHGISSSLVKPASPLPLMHVSSFWSIRSLISERLKAQMWIVSEVGTWKERRTVSTPNGSVELTKVAAVAASEPAHWSSNSKCEAKEPLGDGWFRLSLRQSLVIVASLSMLATKYWYLWLEKTARNTLCTVVVSICTAYSLNVYGGERKAFNRLPLVMAEGLFWSCLAPNVTDRLPSFTRENAARTFVSPGLRIRPSQTISDNMLTDDKVQRGDTQANTPPPNTPSLLLSATSSRFRRFSITDSTSTNSWESLYRPDDDPTMILSSVTTTFLRVSVEFWGQKERQDTAATWSNIQSDTFLIQLATCMAVVTSKAVNSKY